MADRFDKFTDQARQTLQLAQEEAQRFKHNYIGTEHLLLGLVRVQEGVGARVLAELGVELNRVRTAVEFVIGRGDRTVAGDIGLTPRSKKVIELAIDTARQLNQHSIGTEHLLLGMVREGEGVAGGVLESLGVTMERVWAKTLDVLAVPPDQRPAPRPASRLPESTLNVARLRLAGRQPGVLRVFMESPVRFDRFTERARLVLQYAVEEAQRLGQAVLGPEHLLLGLVREENGVAARVLSNLGVQIQTLRRVVERLTGRREESAADWVRLSDAAKRVIELSIEEAERLNYQYIGTEHLLLGLALGGEGIASRALESLGIRLEQVRSGVSSVLAQAPGGGPQPSREASTAYSPTVPSLTMGASRALDEAQLAARWFHHGAVGTAHLLVGLVREHDGLAAQALRQVGITEWQAAANLERLVARGEPLGVVAEGLSAGADRVLEDARQEADRRGSGPIGTEHILLGLLAAPDDELGQVLLRELGTTPPIAQAAVERLLESR